MAKKITGIVDIPGELHSVATGNIVASANEIYDYDSSSYQSQLNKQLYNVSAHDSSADAKYTLEEAIAAVPTAYQVGGLILTFISKEEDFEIYQLKSKEWSTDTSKWSIVPNNVVQDNPEYVEVHIDGTDKILYGVKNDGDFYFGAGIPSQIRDYVNEKGEKIDASILEIETRFYNVNAHDGSIGINYTLEEAIAAVPEEYRNGGLILTFNSDGSVVLYQCKIEEFSEDINDWTQYVSKEYVDNSISDVDSSISNIKSSLKIVENKTSDITHEQYLDDDESIILSTDDNTVVTSIKVEKSLIEDEVIEFNNESNTETYVKIGSIDGSSGLFVDNIYDLNGNVLFRVDSSNNILILAGKKYKMIPYIEN